MGMLGLFSEQFGLSAGYIDTDVEEYSLKDYSKRRVRKYELLIHPFPFLLASIMKTGLCRFLFNMKVLV